MDTIFMRGIWTKEHGFVEMRDETQIWNSKHYTLHNLLAPALVRYYEDGKVKDESWFINGKLFNPTGPAFTSYWRNGNPREKKWNKEKPAGTIHNEDGPAIIRYYEAGSVHTESWVLDGVYSNYTGPALVEYDKLGAVTNTIYYLNGEQYPELEWKREVTQKIFDIL